MSHSYHQVLVSFIIVGWNNKPLLEECFKSVQKQTYKQHSTVYVDNGSTDGSVAFVKRNFTDVQIVEPGENLGFAIGNNLGIIDAFKNPDCRYVVLLNSDARLAEDWLDKLLDFAQSHPQGASFQSPTYDYYDHAVLDSRGITIDHFGRAVQLGHRETKPLLKTQKVFGVNAAAALFSRDFLDHQVFGKDYFDSDMWMYLEDVDLAARAILTGWDNWLVNRSQAYHMGSASSSKNPGFSIYMAYRNNLLLLIKNLPIVILWRVIPATLMTDIETLIKLLRHRNYSPAKAIIRGRLASLPMIPLFIKKHRQLQRQKTIDTASLWRLMKP